jgi:hypothetical protein
MAALLLGAVVAVLSAPVALGANVGTVGPYQPGVVNCSSQGPVLRATPPSVWARNTTTGWDREYVGVFYELQVWNGSKWMPSKTSPVQYTLASDNRPSQVGHHEFTVSSHGYYRAVAVAVWSNGAYALMDNLQHRITSGYGSMFSVLQIAPGWCRY